ncbi:cupin domain-containing protein [Nonomuraea sp. NPDC050643]|uniref:cupin domain-containing protein n=1 Tax=Nonomuraea sp. NPDC050643 TaxID=3155660 RepID=UPI00340261AB
MIRVRLAGGFLAAVAGVSATACAPMAEQGTGTAAVAGRAPVAVAVTRPPSETVSPLFEQALPNVKGKTFTSVLVDFPPSARAVPHRHGDAFVYAYVLEGTMRSRLSGEPVRVYRQGQFWVEPPGAHHVLTENTSPTKSAKLLVVFISDTGEKIKVDDPSSQGN